MPDGEKVEEIGVGVAFIYLTVNPIKVSSRSTMDIQIIVQKEDMRDGTAYIQLIVEPGEGASSDEIEVSSTKDRGPFIIGVIIVVVINLLLLGVLVLFKIRDINTKKEREK